jgi:Zn2+/Cd2+-exporting ATPase
VCGPSANRSRQVEALLTASCGLFLVLGALLGDPVLAYLSVAAGSPFALRSTYGSLKEGSIDVNFLMVLAAAGAVGVGRALEAAGLLFLFSLSNTLETFAMSRTRSAIEGLVKLRPTEAVLVTPDGDARVPVERVRLGDSVRISPFEAIPVDGEIVQGETSVNQSSMTGESEPVSRQVGETVLAGTQNLEGAIIIRASSQVGDSTLDRIVELVRDAQENKASGERISSWFGQRYTVLVIGAFGVSLVARMLLGAPGGDAFYQSLILLVALSPCALVISTPATTLSALAWAARRGLLIRGGEYIEAAGRITAVLMDKTGTLTTGEPRLVEIGACESVSVPAGDRQCRDSGCWRSGENMSEESLRLLRIASSAEQYASHPIAQAIVRAASERSLDVPEPLQQRVVPGHGIEAEVEGQRVRIGRRSFFDSIPADFAAQVDAIAAKGMTVALLECGGRFAAFGLRDGIRREVPTALADLRRLGIRRLAMLTGDTPQTARTVCEELGITEVHAGLLPNTKSDIVAEFEREGEQVMMVGDGVNDAPSLARASLGVAMGGLGSDVALDAADVVLMKDSLRGIPELVELGRKTNATIRANLLFGGGVIALLSLSSLFLPVPLWLAVLGHEGSTVLVILNGLRLLRGV